ncbi:MAG: ParA family partition ATPase [Rickettsiales bacterium]
MSKVITVAQQKGGAGKTTLAAHIAVALSQKGNRVAVIDIDPQGSLSYWHKIREERFGEGYTGLTFSSVSGWRVGGEVNRLRRSYNYIVIDSPPHTETEARTAIRNADLIITPVQPSPTDLWATKATIELAKNEKIPMRVVLNRVTANSKIVQKIAEELPELMETRLGNRVMFAAALLEGRCVTEVDPSSQAAKEIKSLVKEISMLIDEPEEDIELAEEETSEKTTKSKRTKKLADA